MPTFTIGQAARLLGVSTETVRRWGDGGQLRVERDGAGNRTVDGVRLAGFATERAQGMHPVSGEVLTSVRNSFAGIVTSVRSDGLVAQVEVQSGPHRVVSVISLEAVEELGIEVGVTVTARVKSTNVHVDRPDARAAPGSRDSPD